MISCKVLPNVPPKHSRNWNKKLAALISSFQFPISNFRFPAPLQVAQLAGFWPYFSL